MSSVNNNIPFVPENTIDPAAGLNESINVIDALMQIRVVSVGTNTPPGSPTNGDRYIVGTSPTGAWTGQANKMARWLDSTWSFFEAVIAVNQADGAVWVRQTSVWAALSGEELPDKLQALADMDWSANTVPFFTGANTVDKFAVSAISRGIIAAGLGNAANWTVVASAQDSTLDRLLRVGSGGWMGQAQPITLVAIDALRVTTVFRPSSLANSPYGTLGTGLHLQYFGEFAFEIFGNVSQSRYYARTLNNGAWLNPVEFWTTANLTPNVPASYTLATLPNAAANPRLQAWCSNLTGGALPVYSDGTNWRRTFDNSIAN